MDKISFRLFPPPSVGSQNLSFKMAMSRQKKFAAVKIRTLFLGSCIPKYVFLTRVFVFLRFFKSAAELEPVRSRTFRFGLVILVELSEKKKKQTVSAC